MEQDKDILVTTGNDIPGDEIGEILGIVWGSSIRAKHIGKDIGMALKNIVGGELGYYSQMLDESRKYAVERMVEKAKNLGADAIIEMRFVTSAVMQGAAEMMAYGTAVKLKK